MSHEDWMRLAINTCREGLVEGQTPFGAVIVRGNDLVVAAHNVVWATTDITAHAEIHAIRLACKRLDTIDLSGCRIYSTCEPCPMCFSATHWAKLDQIIFGASIKDAAGCGFSELSLSNMQMKAQGGSRIDLVSGVLKDDCTKLFQEWMISESRKGY